MFATEYDRLTHYLFRYPAKFHPPLARALIERYSEPGDCILDPFCGSGTLLVEASVAGRNSVGTDVDPVAVFVSSVKAHKYRVTHLSSSCDSLDEQLARLQRSPHEYAHRQHVDITEEEMRSTVLRRGLWVPDIPNLDHWFRRYVVVDLAVISKVVRSLPVPQTHRDFLLLCFASIIRNASNADPVPVSGLEVTSHMRARDAAGRIIDPFALMMKAVRSALQGVRSFMAVVDRSTFARARRLDATAVSSLQSPIDAVITSPPYHNAVDYYRRHTLEMYWLRLVSNRDERLRLLPKYIGRASVRNGYARTGEGVDAPLRRHWHERMNAVSVKRANAFGHYMQSMRLTLGEIAAVLGHNKCAVFVLGHSQWNGEELPTSDLVAEQSKQWFDVAETLCYPVKNRYMSYQRHNGADINEEHVLVLRRCLQ